MAFRRGRRFGRRRFGGRRRGYPPARRRRFNSVRYRKRLIGYRM